MENDKDKPNLENDPEAYADYIPIDHETTILLGLDHDVRFPKRKRLYPLSPFATWTINKNIADYVGLIPAMVLIRLIDYRQYFLDKYLKNNVKGHPFVLEEELLDAFAHDIGVSPHIIPFVLGKLQDEGFLVRVNFEETPFWQKEYAQYDHAWYTLNGQLMDEKFFK